MFFIKTNSKYKGIDGSYEKNDLINLDLVEAIFVTTSRNYFQICFEMSCGKDKYWKFDFPEPRDVAFGDINKKLFGE